MADTLSSLLKVYKNHYPNKTDYKNLSNELTKFFRKTNTRFPSIEIREYKTVRGRDYNTLFEFKLRNLDKDSVKQYMKLDSKTSAKSLFGYPNKIIIYVDRSIFSNPTVSYNCLTSYISNYDKIFETIDREFKRAFLNIGNVGIKVINKSNLYKLIILGLQIFTIMEVTTDGNFNIDSLKDINMRRYFRLIRNIFNKKITNNVDIKTIERLINIVKDTSNEKFSYNDLIDDIKKIKSGLMNQTIKESIDEIVYEYAEPMIYTETKKHYKKLKKIPNDLVAYVTIEGENMKDANDKAMIVAYALSYVERIDWYIELIDTADERYLVPHTKQYLSTIRLQLINEINKIMNTKIEQRPIIDIRYPKNYEY